MSFITSKFPVFYEDPFLQYRPFPENPTNYFTAHWHEIIGAFVFYYGTQIISAPLSAHYFGKPYTSLPPKIKVNFDIHVVSMIQCVISIAILIPMWNHPNWANRLEDPITSITGASDYGSLVSAVTAGYFIWDLLVCFQHFSVFGVGFLFHAFAALYVFCCCLIPFCQPWIPAFLLFELSTPFVNFNWFASRLPAGTFSDRSIVINGLCLLFTFFSVRIVWGLYAVKLVATDMFAAWDETPIVLPITVLSLNVFLNLLNIYWFYKMVAIAKKKIFGKKKPIKSE
ncbi:TLC domain-containing protein [Scheffersomyces xylosifermentans]|uniref:TLC domain-containing protein n=1 Tax=Scheffersomyces xylosifermentans TaxID=1304137 RepID=UPI00315DBC6E